MLDLKVIKTVNEIEKQTGQSLSTFIKNVPIKNVITSVKVIPVSDLIDMVKGTSISNLLTGLNIITTKQITDIPVDKLKAVLFSNNMKLVKDIQSKYGEERVIKALSLMSTSQIKVLLETNDIDQVSAAINNALGIIEV